VTFTRTSRESNILTFESTVDGAWDGVRGSPAFAGSLSSANGHRGQALLNSNALQGAIIELDGLQAMGVETVFLTIPYPVLYRPFHEGHPGEYEAILKFYREVVQAVRSHGMGLAIETPVLFTQGGFNRWPLERLDGFFNLNGDSGFDVDAFNAARAAAAETVAQELSPDYLAVMNEPDTSARMTGIPELAEVSGARQSIDVILAALQDERSQGLKLGAGIGSWQANYQDFVSSFTQAAMDYLDLHVFYTNHDFLDRILDIADIAGSAGMPVSMHRR